jgi:hypothetical protein
MAGPVVGPGAYPGPPNPGGGTISDITSSGGTITITGGTGPTTNVEVATPVTTSMINTSYLYLHQFYR